MKNETYYVVVEKVEINENRKEYIPLHITKGKSTAERLLKEKQTEGKSCHIIVTSPLNIENKLYFHINIVPIEPETQEDKNNERLLCLKEKLLELKTLGFSVEELLACKGEKARALKLELSKIAGIMK